jgi:1,5-anhydro-D-fructose reductase (1,5-anhydro-D-mannitol-forming)
MKVSIIGFGKMGEIRALAVEHCGGTVVGVFDTLSKSDKYHNYNTVDEVFDDPTSDAIFVCTPNFLNDVYSIRGIESSKHVFCEKPPATTVEKIENVIKIEKSHDKKLMYGFNHRHHGSIIKMKELMDGGDYGDILWMRGRYGKNVNKDFFDNWRADKELSGGGILIDQGIHMLDLFLYMAGDFDKVQSKVSNQFWKIDGIEDNTFAILENTQKKIVASLHSTMTQWRHIFSFEVFFEGGYMTLNGLKTPSGAYGKEELTVALNDGDISGKVNVEEIFTYPIDDSWNIEVKHFFDSIQNDTPVGVGNTKDALKIMKIIEEIYKNG